MGTVYHPASGRGTAAYPKDPMSPNTAATRASPPLSEARRRDQQLRVHLSYLKLNAAAKVLPRMLVAARKREPLDDRGAPALRPESLRSPARRQL